MSKQATGWKIFLDLCLATQDHSRLSAVFDLLLTAEEKENLALRCLIVQALLKQEKTQREIAEELHVSIAKITRGSNELKRTPTNLLDYLREKLVCSKN